MASPPSFVPAHVEPPRFTVTQLIAEADTARALGEIELLGRVRPLDPLRVL
ncbi:hypothetical protein [Aeoliella sp. SH292]|uniref:hypothetical protein n=1 Tax=Aeoliella sp. SH292 TaxID=3454464 RepID=UPI003F98C1BB